MTTSKMELTVGIVTAAIEARLVSAAELPAFIASTFVAIDELDRPAAVKAPEPEKPIGAVSIRQSLKGDRIISMIDGKAYQTLKRHIQRHGYTPESYRATFGLPASYPMVAEAYSARRRDIAIAAGLGHKS